MQLYDEADGTRKAFLDVVVDIPAVGSTYLVTEKVFSKLLRNGTTPSLKATIKSRMVSDIMKETQAFLLSQVDEQLNAEWKRLTEAFPEPLPEEVKSEPTAKTATRRCSRQLSQSELEDLRQKLLADLGDIY